jgi:mitochondrial fission protein ELM1
MTPTPRTWTLTDGHAGNVRQATALARALDLATRDWIVHARAPWKQFAPHLLPGSGRAFGGRFHAALAQAPALAIGCGRQAALATRVLRAHGAKAIQILDPRIDPRHWDLVIAPSHDRLHGAHVLSLLGSLNPVDDAWLAEARVRFARLGSLPGPRTALLVGGPGAHARLGVDDIDTVIATLDAQVRAEGGTVMATTSRRTPADVAARLRRHYAGSAHLLWCDPRDGANPYPGLLAWADRIVCTADSVNLLSEACATPVPVHVHAPGRVTGRIRQFLADLRERGRIRPLADGLAPFPVVPLRETARVAAQVRQRLPLA